MSSRLRAKVPTRVKWNQEHISRGVSRNPGRGVLTRMLSMNGGVVLHAASWAEFAKVGLRPTI